MPNSTTEKSNSNNANTNINNNNTEPSDKIESKANANNNRNNKDEENNEDEEEEKDPEGENEDDNDQEEDDNDNEDNEFSKRVKLNSHTKEELKALLDEFSPDQHRRFEVFRRTALPKNTVKRLLQNILNQQVSPTLAFVVAGYSKVFIGEITELALDIQKEWNETGPLSPEHIREAYRRYESTTSTRVNYLHKKRLF